METIPPSDWPWVRDGQVPQLPWAALTRLLFCGCVPTGRNSIPVFFSFQRLCPSYHELLAYPGYGHRPCPMRRSKPGRVGTLISKGKHTFHSVEEQSEPPIPTPPPSSTLPSPIVPCPPSPDCASLSPSINSSRAARDTPGPVPGLPLTPTSVEVGGCLHSTAQPCHGSPPDIPTSYERSDAEDPTPLFYGERCLILTFR